MDKRQTSTPLSVFVEIFEVLKQRHKTGDHVISKGEGQRRN